MMNKFYFQMAAAAFILGMTSTSFAAANPFSDVPKNHWALKSLNKLAAEGVIEGYEDGTYRGDRDITRFETAQMIARALAKAPTSNISAANRAELDKLAAEFREELDALGVRVENLEKNSDKIKWAGKIEYTYTNTKKDPYKTGKLKEISSEYIFRLEPKAEINENWTANARLDAKGDMRGDTTSDVELKRVWAEGDYDKFNIKLGRMEFYPNEDGLIFDTEFSGAQLTFGKKWQVTALGGAMKADEAGGGILGEVDDDTHKSELLGANVQYNAEKGIFGGAGWYRIKDDDFKTVNYSKDGNTNKANIWSANLGYAFNDKLKLSGAYARNTKADTEKYSWQAVTEYGNYDDYPEKGDWSVLAGYRRYGTNTSFSPTAEDVIEGTKGWFIGAFYSPFKNIGVGMKYFRGKYITDNGKASNIWGRVEFFF